MEKYQVRPVSTHIPTANKPIYILEDNTYKSAGYEDAGRTSRIFTPDGRPQNKLQKGVNLLRTGNGPTRKVRVK